ncbi:hypothetical protein [Mycobacteroides sp. PCS013]|uniref:hypothetical protein n=1 Tax=Mycobacteroides sp. PCS013 TaxID=3074106 RepID=UPI003C2E59D3
MSSSEYSVMGNKRRPGLSPLRKRGGMPSKYVAVPNEFARDVSVTAVGKAVMLDLLSNDETKWRVSIRSLAQNLGMDRKTVKKGVDSLVAAGWLAVRDDYSAYLVHRARRLTVDEIREFMNETTGEGDGGEPGPPVTWGGGDMPPVSGGENGPRAVENWDQQVVENLDHIEDYLEEKFKKTNIEAGSDSFICHGCSTQNAGLPTNTDSKGRQYCPYCPPF